MTVKTVDEQAFLVELGWPEAELLYYWELSESELGPDWEMNNIAEGYAIIQPPEMEVLPGSTQINPLNNIIVFGKHNGQWHANTGSVRPLIKTLLDEMLANGASDTLYYQGQPHYVMTSVGMGSPQQHLLTCRSGYVNNLKAGFKVHFLGNMYQIAEIDANSIFTYLTLKPLLDCHDSTESGKQVP